MLKIGDQMPEFEVVDQDGNKVSSKDLKGKKTIVYFYPKDNTPGCTAEACNLRDNHEALAAKGTMWSESARTARLPTGSSLKRTRFHSHCCRTLRRK